MVYSMTGYGQATGVFGSKSIKAEIRSLNGKTTDVRVKVPALYRTKELEIRNLLLERSSRGKIDITVTFESDEGDDSYKINSPLIKHYYEELAKIADDYQLSKNELLPSILRIPNVVELTDKALDEDEWLASRAIINEAVDAFNNFRQTEGEAMKKDMLDQVDFIHKLLEDVVPFEESRITALKEKMNKNLKNHNDEISIDKNRLEQEILYYLEKLDITEEKIRLAQHCKYFTEVMNGSEKVKGKKLSFISQEMGREMNTLGSKAQHSDIQQIVVNMKDALEKIKEQILNIV